MKMKRYDVFYDGFQQDSIKAVSNKMALNKALNKAIKINAIVPSHFPKIDGIIVVEKS